MKRKIWIGVLAGILLLCCCAGGFGEADEPRESFDVAEQIPVLPLPELEYATVAALLLWLPGVTVSG